LTAKDYMSIVEGSIVKAARVARFLMNKDAVRTSLR